MDILPLWGRIMGENKKWELVKKQQQQSKQQTKTQQQTTFNFGSLWCLEFLFLLGTSQYSKYIYKLTLKQLERKGEFLDFISHS